jgi:hypothetical protein
VVKDFTAETVQKAANIAVKVSYTQIQPRATKLWWAILMIL